MSPQQVGHMTLREIVFIAEQTTLFELYERGERMSLAGADGSKFVEDSLRQREHGYVEESTAEEEEHFMSIARETQEMFS